MSDNYVSKKKISIISVKIKESDFKFFTGKHNELQKVVIKEFVLDAERLYMRPTTEKSIPNLIKLFRELKYNVITAIFVKQENGHV